MELHKPKNLYELLTLNMEQRFANRVAFRWYDADQDVVMEKHFGEYAQDIRRAVNYYLSTIQAGREYTLLEVDIDTGRKNQIRAHLSELGCPVAGDRDYGAAASPLGRLCLHAHELALTDPFTGEERTFRSGAPRGFRALVC